MGDCINRSVNKFKISCLYTVRSPKSLFPAALKLHFAALAGNLPSTERTVGCPYCFQSDANFKHKIILDKKGTLKTKRLIQKCRRCGLIIAENVLSESVNVRPKARPFQCSSKISSEVNPICKKKKITKNRNAGIILPSNMSEKNILLLKNVFGLSSIHFTSNNTSGSEKIIGKKLMNAGLMPPNTLILNSSIGSNIETLFKYGRKLSKRQRKRLVKAGIFAPDGHEFNDFPDKSKLEKFLS